MQGWAGFEGERWLAGGGKATARTRRAVGNSEFVDATLLAAVVIIQMVRELESIK